MVTICDDPKSDLINMLSAQGFHMPSVIIVDKLTKMRGAEDAPNKKSAWFVYHEMDDTQNDGAIIGVASYGDFKLDISETWSSRSEHKMSDKERANYVTAREDMRAKHEEEKNNRQKEAAKTAFDIWSKAPTAKTHQYLKSKGVKTTIGLKIANDGRLIIPIAVDNQIVSLQYINDASEKRFLTGGRLKGGWFMIEGKNDVIYIAEGYSTGASVHEATGKTVYIAFNAGNLYEVTSYIKNKHKQSRIIIAGDDDFKGAANVGRSKAEQASEGLGVEVVFPNGVIDFNDMHHEQGMATLKEYLVVSDFEVYEEDKTKKSDDIERPDGLLGEIYDYYNATSGNVQHGWAIQTALAIVSVVAGRSYKSNFNNFTSLYFMCVGESGTGKEHIKTTIEEILEACGLGHHIVGDGYTSPGAVYSTLLDKPNHIAALDELGKYLEASKAVGSSMQKDANTQLIEAWGRCHGVMRPLNYSTMTAKKADADLLKNRRIYNPALTIIGMTTPCTLFDFLDISAVKDGFINRFCISISDVERGRRMHKEGIEVPQSIIDGLLAIHDRPKISHIATEKTKPVNLTFTEEANEVALVFEDWCIDEGKRLKKYQLNGLTMRGDEIAKRVSMCHALSRDPQTDIINGEDMAWSTKFKKSLLKGTIKRLKVTISQSSFESDKKEILADLRNRGKKGITWSNAQKNSPYSKHRKKDLEEILNALIDAELAVFEMHQPPKGGRPSKKWTALK